MTTAETLVLPIKLLSKNGRDKLTWRQRHRLRRDYLNIVHLKYPHRADPPQCKQRVKIIRVMGPREREWDTQNIGAGTAVELVDALKLAGYFIDDSPKFLETDFAQERSSKIKGPAVFIEIKIL